MKDQDTDVVTSQIDGIKEGRNSVGIWARITKPMIIIMVMVIVMLIAIRIITMMAKG